LKQYTTPTITITIEGASEILANADRVIVTFARNRYLYDLDGIVDGDTVTVSLTQEQTATLKGSIQVEVSVVTKNDNGSLNIIKSETMTMEVEPSIKQEIIEDE
jgi:hypothetical protein